MFSIRAVTVAMMLLRPLLFPLSWLQNGHVMSMQPVPWPDPDPVVAAAIGAMYGSRKTEPPLAVTVRDRLGEWLRDEEFAAAFGVRGRPGWPPSRLALVTVLQRVENPTDRMAAEAARTRLDWKYLLGLPLEDPGFDHSVLPEFRAKVADAGLEQVPLDALLERLAPDGLVKAGGKQRADSTHVVAAVAELNQLDLARGERPGRRRGPGGRAPGLGGRCPARERVDTEVRHPGPRLESPRLEEEAGRARRHLRERRVRAAAGRL
jgi:transposase